MLQGRGKKHLNRHIIAISIEKIMYIWSIYMSGKNTKIQPRFISKAGETCGLMLPGPLQIRTNFPEMRSLGTFYPSSSNCCHESGGGYKNFSFSLL